MGINKNISYKYCIVPNCTNTTKTTPSKWFFPVPKNEAARTKWCEHIKRWKLTNHPKLSAVSSLYCCEDHFNLQDDTDNFMRYQIMAKQEGKPVSLRLKKGVYPHKFECQKTNKQPVPERTAVIKRPGSETVQMATSETISGEKVKQIIEIDEYSNTEDAVNVRHCATGPSLSSMDINTTNDNKLTCDKYIPVKHEHKRSKCVNIRVCGQTIVLTPFHESNISDIKSLPFQYESNNDHSSMTSQSSAVSNDYESTSSEDDEYDKRLKHVMHCGMLTPVERKPELILGLP